MPYQINRRPVGADDILGAKSWPTFPAEMADSVVMVYDARDEYLAGMSGFTYLTPDLSLGASGAGGVTTFAVTVPNNESWYVQHFSLGVTIAGTSSVLSFQPVIYCNPATVRAVMFGPERITPVNTANGEIGYVGWECDFYVPPGSSFAIKTGPVVVTGGNPTVQGAVRRIVTRL